jgi:outer membrane protein assembly factor BamA
VSTSLLAGARALQEQAGSPVNRTEILSYEGEKVSSVELAGQPELNAADFMPLIEQHSGEGFSAAKIDQSIAALQKTGKFREVQLDLRPEQEGVRVMFVLQPAVYFGTYQFSGGEEFAYTRLLQVASYSPQEPYSPVDIEKGTREIQTFLHRNGYFQSEVHPEVHVDEATGLANVDFQIKLNRRAKFGDLVINGPAPDQAQHLKDMLRSIRARLKSSAVREGKSYSLKTLEKATQYLEARLQSEDRLAARVQLIGANYNAETNKADITYDVDIGPIVHGEVSGVRVWPWTRHKLLPIYQQNGLTPELIQEGRQNLLREFRQGGLFGGFHDVQVDTETKVEPNGVSVLYKVKQGPRKSIKNVAFSGNDHFDEEELEKHVVVEESRFLWNGSYNEASIKTLQAFYQSKGFNEVKVTPEFNTKGNEVVVTFAVKEGPQDTVENFRIVGNNTLTIQQLAPDGLRLANGQPYAQKSIDDDRNKIMSHYLDNGYLTATFHVVAQASADNPHKFDVEYDITEGPQVKTNEILTVGRRVTHQGLIDTRLRGVKPGDPLRERDILSSETRLYNTGVFDWAEVNTRRQAASQEEEDVVVKVHESKRNTITYGFGFEVINRGGSVPSGAVAVPGLPQVGLPSTFKTSQQNFTGPRFNFQYTRNNIRGRAETATFGALYSPLDRRLTFLYQAPNFRWTNWTASFTSSADYSKENPIFNSRQGQAGFQLQRPLNDKRTQNLFLRYTYTQAALTNLLIPELVPTQDLHTRLSTLAVVWIRDTRDNALDAHKGLYDSLELDLNPQTLGSNVSFGKFLAQAAAYKQIGGIVWANSLRIGLEAATGGSHVPIGQEFFTGGGSTLRGFPLNGAGPQRTVPACNDPSDPSTCAFIRVPTGGRQLFILNSEFRIPLPIKKGLSLATFYDGGNVFGPVGFKNFGANYTNSVGLGLRYATPVGPIRVDVGHNLSPIPGISATQYFITLGQAF